MNSSVSHALFIQTYSLCVFYINYQQEHSDSTITKMRLCMSDYVWYDNIYSRHMYLLKNSQAVKKWRGLKSLGEKAKNGCNDVNASKF